MRWTFPFLGETKELNDALRAQAPGSFARLSDGYTHYELDGHESGRAVVLVHGFSVPYFIWDRSFAFLAKSDFRVLRYDLLGRGYSDKPKLRYDIDLFCEQLRELLDKLSLDKVSLIGLSMGGPICASFTSRVPERVEKLVLVDPAGARPIQLSIPHKIILLPGIGELVMGLFGSNMMLGGIAEDFFEPDLVREFQDKFRVQLGFKGFKRAILSTMRNQMLGDFSPTYRAVGKLNIPTMLLWGMDDKTVPFSHSEDIKAAIPGCKFHAFEDCGHLPHIEKSEQVDQLLLEFLE